MTHFSPREFVDAAEGTLGPDRLVHAEQCASCRQELESLRDTLRQAVVASDVPEPSPLFWDHMARRVHERAAATPAPFWSRFWQPVAAAAALAVVVAVAVMTRDRTQNVASPTEVAVVAPADAVATEPDAGGQDEALAWIASLASTLPSEELREAARPSAHAAAAAIEGLTPEQQAELVRLIKAEIDGGS
jgi:hypothetical protein